MFTDTDKFLADLIIELVLLSISTSTAMSDAKFSAD